MNKFLSPVERVFVEELRANTGDKDAYAKLSVLVMMDEGFTQTMISVSLGIGLGTVNKYKQKYEQEGLERYLDRHYVPYQGKLNDEQLVALEDEVTRTLYVRSEEIVSWIWEHFEVEYSLSGIRDLLKRLGFVYKKTSSLPGGLDVAQQEAFLKELEPFLAEAPPQEAIYFMDAVHPQHNTRSDYAWIKRGEERLVPANTGRRRLNLNGAMNAHVPEEIFLVEAPTINAQATIQLCEKLLEHNVHKEKIYVLCDNARYYSCTLLQQWLKEHPKIQILHLPPYSPNLNLIERLWKLLRKEVISLHYYPQFQQFRQAILDFFSNITAYRYQLRSLMKPNFQRFSASPVTSTSFS